MKLVLNYRWGDEGCSGTSHLAFDYESKEQFIFDILEKYKDKEWKEWKMGRDTIYHEKVELIEGVELDKFDINDIERSVYELDEWFELTKEEIKI